MTTRFKALVLDQRDKATTAAVTDLGVDDLPAGDVLVDVAYSTLNYKDGLAITGKGRIVRSFPMVPGIDFAGTVTDSQHPGFAQGDEVVLTGWGVGEKHWGGMAQRARVKGDWLVELPEGLDAKRAVAIGTAGFTAMLAVMALEEHGGLRPGDGGEVLVTGAGGGVGGVAVAVLAKLGHRVVAASRREELRPYLESLGAAEVVGRDAVAGSGRPLESTRWAGAVDAVGGEVLAGVLKAMRQGAAVAACGNAGGVELNTTVLPFILRGVRLLGIDSVYCPMPRRVEAWRRLARDLPPGALDAATSVAALGDVPRLAGEILAGRLRGRTVVDVNA